MIDYIRERLKIWLGVVDNEKKLALYYKLYKDLVDIGVDVHFTKPTQIIIISKLNGGMVTVIESNETIEGLQELIKNLRKRYHTNNISIDVPRQYKNNWRIF